MRVKIVLAAAVLGGLAASPTLAVPYCTSGPGFSGGLSIHFGNGYDREAEQRSRISTDLMRLRQAGVDADSLDYWNGCIRAYVRKPGGGVQQEFYDPASLRRVG